MGLNLNQFERYTVVQIPRSEIKNAPYNPRVISAEAKRRLKKNIENVGLLAPIVWNERTGNCVSGHQRLAVLDALNKSREYQVTVAKVDLDEETEKAQVVFMNNEYAQGEWDLEKLGKLFTDDKVDFETAGFDTADICKIFGDNPLLVRPEKLNELADQLRKVKEVAKRIAKRIEEAESDELDSYLVIVFRSHDERLRYTQALGLEDNRFAPASILDPLIVTKDP